MANMHRLGNREIKASLKGTDLYVYFKFGDVPNFSMNLLKGILDIQKAMISNNYLIDSVNVKRLIVKSHFPRFHHLGGDLEFFTQMIKDQNREALISYSHLCLDAMEMQRKISQDIITISHLEGHCLGGGLEAALAGQYVFASNHNIAVGFPESRFGLYPGHGGHWLCRELLGSEEKADNFLQQGKVFKAQEAIDIGLIDGVVDRVPEHLHFKKKMPFDREVLNDQMMRWVDKALELDARNISRMERLVSKQKSFKVKVLARALKPLKTVKNTIKDDTWRRARLFVEPPESVTSSS